MVGNVGKKIEIVLKNKEREVIRKVSDEGGNGVKVLMENEGKGIVEKK